jgi:hypothetical protein
MRTGLTYTSARLLLLVAAMGLLYLSGARGILLLALAFTVSALASYVLLSRQRDVMSAALARRLGRTGKAGQAKPRRRRLAELRSRLEEGARAEDADEPAGPGAPAEAGQPAGSRDAAVSPS